MAFPILSYAIEALRLNKTKLIKLEHPWSRAFMKVFDTFDNSIIMQCQLFTGVLPMYHQYAKRAMTFYYNLKISSNIICREIFSLRGVNDVSERLVMYGNERPMHYYEPILCGCYEIDNPFTCRSGTMIIDTRYNEIEFALN